MANRFGEVDPNVQIHEVKGYYQGEDNQGVPVSLENLLRSVSNNKSNGKKLHDSNLLSLKNKKQNMADANRENNLLQQIQRLLNENSILKGTQSISSSDTKPSPSQIPQTPEQLANDKEQNPRLSNGRRAGRPGV